MPDFGTMFLIQNSKVKIQNSKVSINYSIFKMKKVKMHIGHWPSS
jgi:hypothetical protein